MPNTETIQGILISDFNTDVLVTHFHNSDHLPAVQVAAAPFNQVMPTLLSPQDPAYQDKHFLFVWAQPERLFNSFRRLADGESVALQAVLAEVDHFVDRLLAWERAVPHILVASWVVAPCLYQMNVLRGMRAEGGIEYVLARMNARLMERLADCPSIHVLNARGWTESVGKGAFNPKLWYLSKIPFDLAVFKEAVAEVKSALQGFYGHSRKLIVLDLDDTLWGGIVGDDGWQQLRLGGHDPLGEAFVDFQHALKALKRQGVILGIVSKNDESTALEAIRKHPDMVLKEDDFAAWKINWSDKALNLAALTESLNLGLSAVVFIDDNPVERARVRESLPEVLVPEWPQDKMLYRQALLTLPCFSNPALTTEDAQRTRMYGAERGRNDLMQQVGSLEEWIKSLQIQVKVAPLTKMDLTRTAQLLNKTNQMNLSTRRLSERELEAWADHPSRRLWTFRVLDKFGDSGLTGIASLEIDGTCAIVVDFILSCRVFGRRIEDLMLNVLYREAKTAGVKEIKAVYVPTEKNKPCLDFLLRSGMTANGQANVFVWDMALAHSPPEGLTMELHHV